MKVVINVCFGGFGLSRPAVERYAEIKGIKLWVEEDKYGRANYWTVPPKDRQSEESPPEWSSWPLETRLAWNERHRNEHLSPRDVERDDPVLVQVVEALGAAASDQFAELKVVEIPDGVKYEISEYDGNEHIAETHRTWS